MMPEQPSYEELKQRVRELEKAEQRLQESEDLYRSVIRQMNDGLLLVDPQTHTILEANNALAEMLGYCQKELEGLALYEIAAHPPKEIEGKSKKGLEFGLVKPFEALYKKKDGTVLDVEVCIARIQSQSKDHLLGVVRDVSQRKIAEKQKQQLLKAESLARMAGAIAHHYNNLLFAVIGYLELAMEDEPKISKPDGNLAQALESAHRASRISRLMLTYLGQTPGRQETLDLGQVCSRSLSTLQGEIPENISLKTELPSSGLQIKGNAEQIQQIIDNLISNAQEAIGKSRGSVHFQITLIKGESIPRANRFPVEWQALQKDYACLEVSDTGCGIEGETIGKLFDPFFTDKLTGRGLGLAVALGNVKNHRGCITVESEPGQGSLFRVFLPLEKTLPPKEKAKKSAIPSETTKGTLLVVDDQKQVRKVAQAMLKRLGFEVLTARDGAEAVDILRENQEAVQLVLSDLSMPGMNGWETLAALRSVRSDIPVILSSGYDEAHALSGHHEEQPQAFLPKPYQMQDLKETLGRVLD